MMVLLEILRADPKVEQIAHQHDAPRRAAQTPQVGEERRQSRVVAVEVHVPDEDEIATVAQGRTPGTRRTFRAAIASRSDFMRPR